MSPVLVCKIEILFLTTHTQSNTLHNPTHDSPFDSYLYNMADASILATPPPSSSHLYDADEPAEHAEPREPVHYIFRVGDGVKFKNSKFPFWGVKKYIPGLPMIQKMLPGDVMWFLTSKKFGGEFIAMAEFTRFYDRDDEPIFRIDTYTDAEQGWTGDGDWSIQVHYTNLFIISNAFNLHLPASIDNRTSVHYYRSYKNKIPHDLPLHHRLLKTYGSTVTLPLDN